MLDYKLLTSALSLFIQELVNLQFRGPKLSTSRMKSVVHDKKGGKNFLRVVKNYFPLKALT